MDEDEISIILKWREEGRRVLEDNKLALAELNAALAYRDALRAAGVIAADAETVATATDTAATVENADAQADDAAATEENAASQAGLASLLWGSVIPAIGASITTLGPWVLLIGGATAALFPFVAILTAAVVIITSFTAGATAMVAVVGSMAVLILGLGAAVLYLGNAFGTTSTWTAKLVADLKEMGGDLAQAAAPSANAIFKFLDNLIPLVESQGEGILSWFGARLPNALSAMNVVIRDIVPQLDRFGAFLGSVYDKTAPQIGPLIELLAKFGLGAVQGLIQNLVNLSDWFQAKLPSYGPVVSQIFSGIGSSVQWLATQFGNLSDWFVRNWPSIKGNLDAFTSGFGDAFKQLNAIFGGPGSVDWRTFFYDLGSVIGGTAAVIGDLGRAIGIIFSQVVAAMPVALNQITVNAENSVNQIIDILDALISAWDSLPPQLTGGGGIPLIPHVSFGGVVANGPSNVEQTSAGRRLAQANNVTINVNGAQSPQSTAGAVSRTLRKVTQF